MVKSKDLYMIVYTFMCKCKNFITKPGTRMKGAFLSPHIHHAKEKKLLD
jgi:hypothetical protein